MRTLVLWNCVTFSVAIITPAWRVQPAEAASHRHHLDSTLDLPRPSHLLSSTSTGHPCCSFFFSGAPAGIILSKIHKNIVYWCYGVWCMVYGCTKMLSSNLEKLFYEKAKKVNKKRKKRTQKGKNNINWIIDDWLALVLSFSRKI